MVFKPMPSRTQWEALLVAGWIIILDGLLLIWALQRPTDWIRFLFIAVLAASLPFLAHLSYRIWAAMTLEYWLDRNGLTIRYANVRHVIPHGAIKRLVQGGIQDLSQPNWIHWPAVFIRPGRVLGLLDVTMVATRSLTDCILVETEHGVFAISPAGGADQFRAVLEQRRAMGAVRTVRFESERTPLLGRFFGEDRVGPMLLGAGLLGVLMLIGLLMVRYPGVPDALPFHYNEDGLPDLIRDKSSLFLLPIIGFLAWAVNGIWGLFMATRNQRTGAYMLWGGAVVVQLFSLLALISLIA